MNNNKNIMKRLQVIYFLLFTLPGLNMIASYTSEDNLSHSHDIKIGAPVSFVKSDAAMKGHLPPKNYLSVRCRCGVDEKSYFFSRLNERDISNGKYNFTKSETINSSRIKCAIALSLRHMLFPEYRSIYFFRPPPSMYC